MNKSSIALIAGVLIVALLAVLYLKRPDSEPPPEDLPDAPETESAGAGEAPAPAIRYPLPEPAPQARAPEADSAVPRPETEQLATEQLETEQVEQGVDTGPPPLPTLDDSDERFKQALFEVAPASGIISLFKMDRMIRRFVVTVDNLPREKQLRPRYSVAEPTAGRLIVEREGDALYLSSDNFARYEPFIQLVEAVDTDRLVTMYLRFYPLIQRAYQDLGYPSNWFNDRLIDVIDHLLTAPDVTGRIRLVRPHVLYKYADPELEAQSAGHKVLIRMGPENASRLKARLRDVRRALVQQ
jgi:hypothetical protein